LSNTILTGVIRDIFPEKRVSDRFRFTEIWLLEQNTQYPQVWPIQVWNDDAKMLRHYNTGDLVNVHYAPIGRLSTKNGEEFVYVNLRGLKIEKLK
jgi:hypothetical protein